MSPTPSYTPTNEDLVNVIQLLHNNGIDVSTSKKAYEELKQYETNPFFCVLLSSIFAASSCPVPGIALTVDWKQYRQLAGLTLKNNLSAARHALGEEAVLEAARSAITCLTAPPSVSLTRVSAQIVVKITQLTSFTWWSSTGLVADLSSFLLQDLLHADEMRALGALFTLQYMMEDLSKMVGGATESIIKEVSLVANNKNISLSLRKAAFRLCFSIYEQSSFLDWNVDTLSIMQIGLANASWPFACICTSILESEAEGDVPFQLDILRTILLLLPYGEYFQSDGSSGLSFADQERLQRVWIGFVLRTIGNYSNYNGKTELVAAGIDVISEVLDNCEQSGGEGPFYFLAVPVKPMLSPLLGALVECSFLTDERVEEILKEDNYMIRSTYPGSSCHDTEKAMDIADDTILDDDDAAETLRHSSIKCISSLCQFDETAVMTILMPRIEDLWSQANHWKARELGFVLCGTIADALGKNEALLPGLVEHAGRVSADTAEHVCVISMALWALSCVLEHIHAFDKNLFDSATSIFARHLESTSKRVQFAALTGMLRVVEVLELYVSPSQQNLPFVLIERFAETLCRCLSVYHTSNLSQLVTLLIKVLPYPSNGAGGDSARQMIVNAIRKERPVRATLFEASYIKAYVDGAPNVLLDKDIIHIDRAVLALLVLQPNSSYASDNLKTWSTILQDIFQRNVTDDVELLQNTILSCAGYIKCVNTCDFHQCLADVLPKLYSAAFQVWKRFSHRSVMLAAVTLMKTVIEACLAAGCPGPIGEEEQAYVLEELEKEEDLSMKNEILKLGMLLVQQHPTESCSQRTFASLNSALRSDVYGESLLFYIDMACSCCATASSCPGSLLPLTKIDVLTQLLTQSTNDLSKGEATVRLCNLVSQLPPQSVASLLPDLLRLLYSWQQVAYLYPGTLEALQAMLKVAQQHCQGLLQQLLSEIPPTLCRMIQEVYHL